MSKLCASCGKQVYPVEELKCSDQVYHKGCFRCSTCNLQLNLKNFKISEGKPYCNTHYPTQRAYTVVKDTPEMDRVTKNMQVVSKVAYTGQLEKRNEDEARRPPAERELGVPPKPRIGSIADYDPMSRPSPGQPARPPPAHAAAAPQPQYNPPPQQYQPPPQPQYQPPPQPQYQPPPQPQYQPPAQPQYQPPAQPQYQPPAPAQAAAPARASGYGYGQPTSYSEPAQAQPQRQSFSQPDPEPQQHRQSFNQRDSYNTDSYQPPASGYDSGAGAGAGAGAGGASHNTYRAMFEYVASDGDEVSFLEGDLIVNGEPIDEGWMYGTVERTGKRGMLPSNYVEPV